MKLSHRSLWQLVKVREGKMIYTVVRRSPNKILEVTENKVEIEGKTPVYFKGKRGIFANYHTLIKDGYLIGKSGEDRMMRANIYPPTRYVIIAILQDVLPDETEEVKGGIRGRGSK